jgi:hypothetical protein
MLATEWSTSLDMLRHLVRTDESLRKLGTRFGSGRAYTSEEVQLIRAAHEARQTARKPKVPAV